MNMQLSPASAKFFTLCIAAMIALQAQQNDSCGWGGWRGDDDGDLLELAATPGALQNALEDHPHGGLGYLEDPQAAINSQGTPIARSGTPIAQSGTPLGDVGIDGTTGAQRNNPYAALDQLAPPAADVQSYRPTNRTPSLDPGAVDASASPDRQAAREAAMKNPKTAALFQGDAAARQAAALKRIAAATAGPAAGRLDANAAVREKRQQLNAQWAATARAGVNSQLGSLFDAAWWDQHKGVLADASWFYYPQQSPGAWWRAATWDGLIAGLGWEASTKPFDYDYGDNVSYQDAVIYVNGQPVCSYEDYVAAAQTLANAPAPAAGTNAQWMSLGTFAMSQSPDQSQTTMTLQLVADKKGNLSGTYFNLATGDTQVVHGSIDKMTQRAAFTIGANKTTVLETGLANLTEDQSQIWVHFPDGHSQIWLLARLTTP